eukprot:scaffold421274_cov61-Attheya_sp.AAC.1
MRAVNKISFCPDEKASDHRTNGGHGSIQLWNEAMNSRVDRSMQARKDNERCFALSSLFFTYLLTDYPVATCTRKKRAYCKKLFIPVGGQPGWDSARSNPLDGPLSLVQSNLGRDVSNP